MRHADRRATFDELLRRHLPALRRLVASYTRDAAGREDLVQEIALGLWTALPRFRGDASERTWLYRVAHNTAITHMTRHHRRASRERPGDLPEVPAPAATQESTAIDAERRERLWAAVGELPLVDRQIVVLHLEGLSAAEIEAVTGLSAGSIATRLTRTRQKLAASVRRQEERA
ncbi:MAG: sigma-70 family RNA polymerase sigma factor [Vicinamibacteraceae bacterium]